MVIIQAAHLVNSSKCVAHRPTRQLMYAAAGWAWAQAGGAPLLILLNVFAFLQLIEFLMQRFRK